MYTKQKILFHPIENKTVVWFQDNNDYTVVENLVAEILRLQISKTPKQEIVTKLFNSISINQQQVNELIKDVSNLLVASKPKIDTKNQLKVTTEFTVNKYYKINDYIFLVNFLSEYELSLIHPKFAHLEIQKISKIDYHYKVFSDSKYISLEINNQSIGTWTLEDVHYFQGKFSMKITEHIHQKNENEWLGVFHASAISNGKESMLFLGDSGNGKSTSLALLQANKFNCLADDFVPIDANKREVYSFPSAISIKKNSLNTLLPIYPELKNSAEYHFKKLNKIVRFLKPNNSDYTNHFPCKALIFIKYEKDSDLIINKVSKIDAFELLVPDSWLSPIPKNVEIFLNWFSNLPCYQLTYSNNKKMIETVTKIFADDL